MNNEVSAYKIDQCLLLLILLLHLNQATFLEPSTAEESCDDPSEGASVITPGTASCALEKRQLRTANNGVLTWTGKGSYPTFSSPMSAAQITPLQSENCEG